MLADYGRIVPAALLDLAPHGALNLHPSLLPRHRGATPIPAAIAAGDADTGVSLIRMDAGIDTGPLVAQRRVPLHGDEDAPGLEARLAAEAARLLVESLPGWLDGSLPAVPQPADGATLTRPFRREDGRLDPGRPALELDRQVRALRPWPGTFLDRAGRAAPGPCSPDPSMRPPPTGRVPGDLVLRRPRAGARDLGRPAGAPRGPAGGRTADVGRGPGAWSARHPAPARVAPRQPFRPSSGRMAVSHARAHPRSARRRTFDAGLPAQPTRRSSATGAPACPASDAQALEEWCIGAGEAGWRARQVSDAIWSGRAAAFDDIPQLPSVAARAAREPVPGRHPGGDHGPTIGWWPDREGAPSPR